MKSIHTVSFRVYYEDTDAAGVVYHSNYLKFAERARTEWLRSFGFDQSKLMETDEIVIPVFHLKIDYLKPARLDDLLHIETEVTQVRNVRMIILQKIKKDQELLAALEVHVACCNLQNKPTKWPERIIKAINFRALD